jgi:hypothetical protein
MSNLSKLGLAVAFAALAFAPQAAVAQEPIGGVESLRNQVTRAGAPVRLGDRVFQNEVIATGSDSSARIAFLDQTNLAIGPTSRVTLDRFVYNAAQQGMSVNLSQGAFRFTTGSINKSGSIQVIVATGDSMTPTINPRDLLFVDTAVTEFSGDGIYLIRRDHGLSCKRLSMAGRTLLVTSDNPVARDWKWKDKRESDAIIGRVMAALPMTFKQFY